MLRFIDSVRRVGSWNGRSATLGAPQNLVDVTGSTAIVVRKIDAIRHQGTRSRFKHIAVHRGQAPRGASIDNRASVSECKRVGRDDFAASSVCLANST